MTNVQERAALPALALQNAPELPPYAGAGAARSALARADRIRRIAGPRYALPLASSPAAAGPLDAAQGAWGGIVQQLLGIVQQLLSMLGMNAAGNSLPSGAQNPGTYFQSASASSTGDPHLAFRGTGGNGAAVQNRFDSMSAHEDLLDSDSFAGGYRISTSVTQPAQNGVTYNRQAIVSTDFGGTQVSLDDDGNAAIVRNGETISLAAGQSLDLGDGETIARNADGSLVVRDVNGLGGSITATLARRGRGVDVSVQSEQVDLGGDVVNAA